MNRLVSIIYPFVKYKHSELKYIPFLVNAISAQEVDTLISQGQNAQTKAAEQLLIMESALESARSLKLSPSIIYGLERCFTKLEWLCKIKSGGVYCYLFHY